MRAITVRQPWASAIARGEKDVENRSRNIVGSFRGPVAIHAAKGTGTLDEYGVAARRIASLTGFLPFATLPAGLGVVGCCGRAGGRAPWPLSASRKTGVGARLGAIATAGTCAWRTFRACVSRFLQRALLGCGRSRLTSRARCLLSDPSWFSR